MASGAHLIDVLLQALSLSDSIPDSYTYATEHGYEHAELVGALKSLDADAMVKLDMLSASYWSLTAEGQKVRHGSCPSHTYWAHNRSSSQVITVRMCFSLGC